MKPTANQEKNIYSSSDVIICKHVNVVVGLSNYPT